MKIPELLPNRSPMINGFLPDREIAYLANKEEMISPFVGSKVSFDHLGRPVVSYGLGSYGYDCRATWEFKVANTETNRPFDPKNPHHDDFVEWHRKDSKPYFVVQPGQTILTRSKEYFKMPKDVLGIVATKSTYARMWFYCLTTTLEPEWEGNITLEYVNLAPRPVHFYPEEGAARILFIKAEQCDKGYGNGKYQGQVGVTAHLR